MVFQHILVPTDGSRPSIAAGRLAVQLAAALGAQITFVYVVDTAVVDELTKTSGKLAQQVRQELERTGERYLDHLCGLADHAGLRAQRRRGPKRPRAASGSRSSRKSRKRSRRERSEDRPTRPHRVPATAAAGRRSPPTTPRAGRRHGGQQRPRPEPALPR